MSISTVKIIIGRIKSASEESPIAVFKLPEPDGENLDAVFGATVTTRSRISAGDPLFIGNFHKGMDIEKIRGTLIGSLFQPPA